jgi:hypothetical protein
MRLTVDIASLSGEDYVRGSTFRELLARGDPGQYVPYSGSALHLEMESVRPNPDRLEHEELRLNARVGRRRGFGLRTDGVRCR